jgi:hypothetical protein
MSFEDTSSLVSIDPVQPLDLKPVGSTQVRGIVGDAIRALLVYVEIRLVSRNMLINMLNDDDDFVSVLHAVGANLNDQLILSMPVVTQLHMFAHSRADDDDAGNSKNDETRQVADDSDS